MKIGSITNNQMIGIGVGTTAVGLSAGYMHHRRFANDLTEGTKDLVEELAYEQNKNIVETTNSIRTDYIKRFNEKELDELVIKSGKKHLDEVPLEEILNSKDLENFKQVQKEMLEAIEKQKKSLMDQMHKDIKVHKLKTLGIYGGIGLALAGVLPAIKCLKNMKKNEDKPKNNISK